MQRLGEASSSPRTTRLIFSLQFDHLEVKSRPFPQRLRILIAHALLLAAISPVLADDAPLWSLQPVKEQAVPVVRDKQWPAGRVDRFILAELEQHGLSPNRDAEPATLLRRLHFDLVGLPPSLEEIAAFEQSWALDREAAIARVVDDLLASPDFGVRWGRHWLDVARYAESSGIRATWLTCSPGAIATGWSIR